MRTRIPFFVPHEWVYFLRLVNEVYQRPIRFVIIRLAPGDCSHYATRDLLQVEDILPRNPYKTFFLLEGVFVYLRLYV